MREADLRILKDDGSVAFVTVTYIKGDSQDLGAEAVEAVRDHFDDRDDVVIEQS